MAKAPLGREERVPEEFQFQVVERLRIEPVRIMDFA
jgi:hypothetical protein